MLATSLDLLPVSATGDTFDQLALAHALADEVGADVAAAAAFLVGPDARCISGVGLLVDAGMRASSSGWRIHAEAVR